MAAKLLHSLADDNPDLQKQIGCMTGIFQIFDRHHALTGRRLSHRRVPPPGEPELNDGSSERESFNIYPRATTTDMNLNLNQNEKPRISTESARPSFSSSFTSMSQLGCNKPAPSEASSFDRIVFPETPSRDAVLTQPSTSPHFGLQSLDLRDVVKDSMYREARGLSVKNTGKEEAVGHAMKHKDSPRPLQSKPENRSYRNMNKGKQNANSPADLNESLRILAKLQEAPWYYNENREQPRALYELRDRISHTISKDAPRFSYDGRERNCLSFESGDAIKSIVKLKELPRHSLDCREISLRGSNIGSKASCTSKNLKNDGNSNEVINLQQSLGTEKRHSNVVAKLMGLGAFPDSASTSSSQSGLCKSFPVEQSDSSSMPLKTNGLNRPIRIPKSPRSLSTETMSPRWKNPDLIMKPVSRLPIEPAPWKQPEGSRTSQKPVKPTAKTGDPFPTVYGEIEKILKDLEFKQSGKDLRALKQILEAMRAKGLLETRKEEQGSKSGSHSHRDYELRCASLGQKPRWLSPLNQQANHNGASSTRGSDLWRTCESPIVIMKPAKLVEKSVIHTSSVISVDGLSGLHKTASRGHADDKSKLVNSRTTKDQSPRITRESAVNSSDKKGNARNRAAQSSTRPQQLPKESTTSSVKSTGSVSPRLNQKKLELEKRSRPPTPPCDSSKPRRQSNTIPNELGSPGGKSRSKSDKLPLGDDQLSQTSNESRTSCHQCDDVSLQWESTVVFDLRTDVEVTSTEQLSELGSCHSPSLKSIDQLVSVSKQINPTVRLEDGLLAELAVDTPEHHSPVSVLDASVYRDDALSPEKQLPNVPAGEGGRAEDSKDQQTENQRKHADDDFLSDNVVCGLSSDISRKKLQDVENLVQKLRRLNSTHDEISTDYIAFLCENTNPDQRYISEILLASGLLLQDLGSGIATFQLHRSGHPINPELFFVLEHKKSSTLASTEQRSPERTNRLVPNQERFHRKLIFDAVNEIIAKKLASVEKSPQPWLKSAKLAKNTPSAQKLLKELCSEIEQLQTKKPVSSFNNEEDDLKSVLWDDVMHRSESWIDFHSELSGLVLDVERSIFKDLVDEIVIGEAAESRSRAGRRKQQFAK